jgi:hypothetical protein
MTMLVERMRGSYHVTVALSLVGALGCGGTPKPTAHEAPATTASVATPPPPKPDDPYDIITAAASCWLGGLWSEAEGDEGAAERRAATAKRCLQAAHALSGQDDPLKVESLRVLDASTTDELVAKVKALAPNDPSVGSLAAAVIAAAQEASAARRASSRIRADIAKLRSDKEKANALERDADRLGADEANLVPALHEGAALDALVKLSAGDHTTDAHVLALLFALTRVRAAQELPKHMRLYTVSPTFAAAFAVPPPQLPEHAHDKLKRGVWLAYVMRAAAACGHPVPDTAKTTHEKESLAWTGVLAGFADRLEADAAQLKNPDLALVTRGVAARLRTP